MVRADNARRCRRRAPAKDTLSHTNVIAPTTISNRTYMAADPLSIMVKPVVGAARSGQLGEHDRHGDKHNNQSNDDNHVDAF
jgi:hypothetical protein